MDLFTRPYQTNPFNEAVYDRLWQEYKGLTPSIPYITGQIKNNIYLYLLMSEPHHKLNLIVIMGKLRTEVFSLNRGESDT
jgi:translation elongation factor EF-4